MAEATAFKYRAFISYSHADTAWAKWLHRGLEGFRVDKDPAGRGGVHIMIVFTDLRKAADVASSEAKEMMQRLDRVLK